MEENNRYLATLCEAMKAVHEEGAEITTASFVALMDVVVRCFDYMGTVMHIAKHELVLKAGTLHAAGATLPTLREVVEADKLAGRATVKDSCARNLHRLACAIKFVRVLLEQLASSPTITVREAANKAYEQSLAPLHIYVVRTAVWAGMYMLPTRDHFLTQLGETDASAIKWAKIFLQCSPDVERQVLRLFNGINMPQGAASSHILSSLWGTSSPAPTAATAAS